MTDTELTDEVLDAPMLIQRHFGLGMLESACRDLTVAELQSRGRDIRKDVPVPLE